jgi:integrase/recombinase XerD
MSGRKGVEHYTGEEVREMIAARPKRGNAGSRDRALIEFLFRSGLRISEALELKPARLDLGSGEVTIHNGKGGRDRIVQLLTGTEGNLEAWLERRASLGFNGRHAIFCRIRDGKAGEKDNGKAGEPISPQAVRAMLQRLARKLDFPKRIHPHGFRHGYAVQLHRAKVSVESIRRNLGHSSLQMTAAYLATLCPREALEEVRSAPAWNEGEKS